MKDPIKTGSRHAIVRLLIRANERPLMDQAIGRAAGADRSIRALGAFAPAFG